MPVEERERRELQEALMAAIGSDQTDTLFSYLPPVGWAEVATTRDVHALGAELRGEMEALRGEMRSEVGQLRGEMQSEIGALRGELGDLRAEMHQGFRVQFYWMATLQLAVLAIVLTLATTGMLG